MNRIARLVSVSALTCALWNTAIEIGSSQQASPQAAIVAQLCQDFAWEAVLSEPSLPGAMDQPRQVLERYFDQNLTALILKDRACAEKKGMCNLDFLPLWDSQNPAVTNLAVSQTAQPNIVTVEYREPRSNKITALSYQLTNTNQGWRISDIKGSNWSLLSILSSNP